MTGVPITATSLTRSYGAGDARIMALDHVDVRVSAGEAVAVTGPSGSGKSTLLHLAGAMDQPTSGTLRVGDWNLHELNRTRLTAYRRTIGFVFQAFHLLPALSAVDNVLAPILPRRTTFDKTARARELLDAVGLADRERALPSQLSGGQQQRVAIARALINQPNLVLADEPTGNLDTAMGTEILDLLFQLRHERGMTLVIATHDMNVADRCDRILRLRDGHIINDQPENPTKTSPETVPTKEPGHP